MAFMLTSSDWVPQLCLQKFLELVLPLLTTPPATSLTKEKVGGVGNVQKK